MSIRPAGRSRPASQKTTSAKVRWMSMPITRCISCSSLLRFDGSSGRHDNYGSALTAQPGRSQGRPANNTSSRLIVQIGLPTDVLPVPLVPDGHTIRQDQSVRAGRAGTVILIPVNNPLERIMKEIRRRTRVVGAFPDGRSCLNLAAARLRYIAGTAWSAKCYMNMRPLYQPQVPQTEAVA